MDFLEDTRRNLGAAPREFSLWKRLFYLNLPRPSWVRGDPISQIFDQVPALLTHGSVVWGQTVQANSMLFEKGADDHPAAVVYCPDTVHPPIPRALAPVATALYGIKGSEPADSQARLIAAHLTDEYSRPFGLPVPESLSAFCPCVFSTIFIARRHLPDRKLSLNHYPLLISNEPAGFCMIVPSKFWPQEFVNQWMAAGRGR